MENNKKVTFEEIAKKFLEDKKANVRISTYKVYEKNFDTIMSCLESTCTMEEISISTNLTTLERKLKEKGFSESKISQLITWVRSIVRFYRNTKEYEGVANSFKKSVIRILNEQEIRNIYKKVILNVSDSKKILAIPLAMLAGMTVSEICALKWGDIDFTHKMICVSRVVQRVSVKAKNRKTSLEIRKKEKRRIPLHDELAKILKRYTETSTNYVVSDSDYIVEPRNIEHFVTKEFDGNIVLGDLRDWFFIQSIQRGIPVQLLAKCTGVTINHIEERYKSFISFSEEELIYQINKLTIN